MYIDHSANVLYYPINISVNSLRNFLVEAAHW